MAVLWQEDGRLAEAEGPWRAALVEQPDRPPALVGLAEAYLKQERWPLLDRVLTQLDERHPGCLKELVLRGRRHLAAREFDRAPGLLAAGDCQGPAVGLAAALSESRLIAGGQGLGGGGAGAPRHPGPLDPNHPEAGNNLEALANDATKRRRVPPAQTR